MPRLCARRQPLAPPGRKHAEGRAIALMDDHTTAIHLGYSATPVQYALAVLSTEMPPVDAGHVLLAATRDDCPNHAADLPAGWR